jgi:hypothetical protein
MLLGTLSNLVTEQIKMLQCVTHASCPLDCTTFATVFLLMMTTLQVGILLAMREHEIIHILVWNFSAFQSCNVVSKK